MNDRLSPAACEPLEARRLLAGTPYLGTPFALGGGPTRVEAEHFDLGGEGVAFHDNDPAWNFGDGRLRPEGVDVRTDPAGLVVGWTRRGEWLEYSLSAAAAGRYAVKLRAAATVSLAGAGISLSVDGRSVGDYALPATKGGFALYDGVTAELAAGPHVLRATFTRPAGQDDIGVADLDYLELSKAGGNGSAQSPFGGAPVTLGSGTARVEAERYDLGGEGVAFHDNDPNYNAGDGRFRPEGVDVRTDPAGLVVGWTRRGEWLEYSLDAATAGRYAVDLRAAATVNLPGAGVSISIDGRPVGDYALPSVKGGFNVYTGLAADVSAGPHVLRVTFTRPAGQDDAGIADLDWIELRPLAPADGLRAKLDRAVNFAAGRLAATASSLGTSQYPEWTNPDGSWLLRDAGRWTSGFLPGQFWEMQQLAARRGQPTALWGTRATAWANGMLSAPPQTEDVGYRDVPSLVPWVDAARALGDGGVQAKKLLDRITADVVKKQQIWNETVGAYRTAWRGSNSGNPRANYGVLLDQNYDMVLQQYALNNDPNLAARADPIVLRDRLRRHAQTVADNLVRPDGSTAHWAYFDRATGERITRETYQGYADDSTWARGQAWAILSFTELAAGAGRPGKGGYDPQLRSLGIATAKTVADWFVAHLPADGVPFWDFDAPGRPNVYRDSSAAAIAATGMIRLAALTGESKYRDAAAGILGSLADAYTAAGRREKSILIHGAAAVPNGQGVDGGTAYGDYYFLRAINLWEAT